MIIVHQDDVIIQGGIICLQKNKLKSWHTVFGSKRVDRRAKDLEHYFRARKTLEDREASSLSETQ